MMEQFLIMVDDWYDELTVERDKARTQEAQVTLLSGLQHLAAARRLVVRALWSESENAAALSDTKEREESKRRHPSRVVAPVRWGSVASVEMHAVMGKEAT